MKQYKINTLISGGLITNYHCTSKCRHCLYNCGPGRPADYMDKKTSLLCFEKIREFGAASVHIGGGEPFLNPAGLESVIECAAQTGVQIEYVETNSSWYKDEQSACRLLERLKSNGLNTLLISISPFHLESIPFSKVENVMAACSKTGIQIFPWMDTFLSDIENFDKSRCHRFEELMDHFGPSYLAGIQRRYWIHPGGRALDTFRPVHDKKSIENILNENKNSCSGHLLDTSHFHIDLYGNYIPGLCSGISLEMNALGNSLTIDKYPLIGTLLEKGITGLHEIAVDAGFKPSRESYISKCDLCTDIRTHLVKNKLYLNELQPTGFYSV